MRKHAAPIIAIVLLLLPVLYVSSYLALVVPGGYSGPPRQIAVNPSQQHIIPGLNDAFPTHAFEFDLRIYRFGGKRLEWFFWPLEQIDRKARPVAWSVPVIPGDDDGPSFSAS
jgi:hypothetical protein